MAGRKRAEPGVDATSNTRAAAVQKAGAKVASGEGAGGATFEKGIVAEIINHPLGFDQFKDDYGEKLSEVEAADNAPRGSLLVKLLSEGATDELTVCYPFFPSQIMLPAKVGEQVWVFLEDGAYGYWLSRITGAAVSEDVNYTHKDRELDTPTSITENAKDKKDKADGKVKNFIARFNNGAGEEAKNSPEGQDASTFVAEAKMPKHIVEAVPRYSPRPGDLVLQGSNNTLISLGTDRGWKKADTEFTESNSMTPAVAGTGTIDIVVGRGQAEEEATPTDEDTKGSDPVRAAPRLVKNERGELETDKTSALNDLPENPIEGDPDFEMDSSRIYISMKSKIDENFSLEEDIPKPFEGAHENADAAAIALKSNNIRILARPDGSVRIVKEKGDQSIGSSIIIESDGSIHISGEKIFLGRSKEHEGLGAGPGPGDSEPYVRYSDLEAYLNDIHSAFDSFCQTLSTHVTPGYGAPSPQILSGASALKSSLSSHKSKIEKFQSKRIFGE